MTALHVILLVSATVPSPHDLVGHWEGSLVCRDLAYEVRVDIAYDDDDVPHATIDLPEHLIYGCPIELTVDGTEVVMRPAFIDGSLCGSFIDDAFVGTGSIIVPESSVALERRSPTPVQLEHEEIRFRSGDADLVGTLVTPPGSGPFPVVVWTHGSGPDTRGTFYYHGRATLLALHGVAGFIYDKRGSGGSSGSGAWKLDVLVGDAIAAVEMLAAREDIDDDRLGVAGFSQGGWVAPDVARKCPKVDFVMVGATPGITVGEQNAFAALNALQSKGYDEDDAEEASELLMRLYRFYQTGDNRDDVADAFEAARDKAWFDAPVFQGMLFLPNNELPDGRHPYWQPFEPDPVEVWRSVRVPVLSMWGALDRQVPAERSRAVIREALDAGGNPDVSLVVFPEASHGFWIVRDDDAPWDWPRQTPNCVSVMLEWVLTRTRPDRD